MTLHSLQAPVTVKCSLWSWLIKEGNPLWWRQWWWRDLTTRFSQSEGNGLADSSRSSGDDNHRSLHFGILICSSAQLLNGHRLSPNACYLMPFISLSPSPTPCNYINFIIHRSTKMRSIYLSSRIASGQSDEVGVRREADRDGGSGERIGGRVVPKVRRCWRRSWPPLRIWEWLGPRRKKKKKRRRKRENRERSPGEESIKVSEAESLRWDNTLLGVVSLSCW